jgi:hypothetical protein
MVGDSISGRWGIGRGRDPSVKPRPIPLPPPGQSAGRPAGSPQPLQSSSCDQRPPGLNPSSQHPDQRAYSSTGTAGQPRSYSSQPEPIACLPWSNASGTTPQSNRLACPMALPAKPLTRLAFRASIINPSRPRTDRPSKQMIKYPGRSTWNRLSPPSPLRYTTPITQFHRGPPWHEPPSPDSDAA